MNENQSNEGSLRFMRGFNEMAIAVNETAHSKGWYDMDQKIAAMNLPADVLSYIKTNCAGTRIALVHSEASEALEAIRHGDPADDKIPEFTGQEAELADIIIRIMDYSCENKLRIAEAIVAKATMNKTRAYKHGGKAI